MRKDLKMGMITGVVIVTIATLIVSITSPTPESMLVEQASIPSPQGEPAEIIQPEIPIKTVEATTPPPKVIYSVGPKIHIVKAGETLSTIAKKYYGTTDAQQTIIDANVDSMLDAGTLRVGTRLFIP